MTLDDIANYCEVKDCLVAFGESQAGFVQVDGTGVMGRYNNYRRFLAHHELSSLPDPTRVLEAATSFVIEKDDTQRKLGREEFEAELERFQELVSS